MAADALLFCGSWASCCRLLTVSWVDPLTGNRLIVVNWYDRSFQVSPWNVSTELLPKAHVYALRRHDYKLLKKHCRSHARFTFFPFRVVTFWIKSTTWGGVCSITTYFQRKTVQVLGPPLLFFGSERVCTETASEQPTGHSGLTSFKGWRRRFQGFKDRLTDLDRTVTYCDTGRRKRG